jgi:hypothetical protein
MSGSKQRLINEEDIELDTTTLVLIGQYQKRLQMKPRGHLDSIFGHEVHNRSRQEYNMKLYQDYFSKYPMYPDKFFRRHFRMRRSLYLHISWAIGEHGNYFVQRRNAAEALRFSCLKKVTATYRQLAYAIPTNYVDDYVPIGESNAIECLRRFVRSLAKNILGLQMKMIQPDYLIYRLYALEVEKLSNYCLLPKRHAKISSCINLKYSCDSLSIVLVSVSIIILSCCSCSRSIFCFSRWYLMFFLFFLYVLSIFSFVSSSMKGFASQSERFLTAFSAFLPGALSALGLVSSAPLAASRLFLPFLDSRLTAHFCS